MSRVGKLIDAITVNLISNYQKTLFLYGDNKLMNYDKNNIRLTFMYM